MTDTTVTLPTRERLRNVTRTTTYLIDLYATGTSPYDDQPLATLGPFTDYEARQTIKTLTCAFRKRRLSRTVPEWATS